MKDFKLSEPKPHKNDACAHRAYFDKPWEQEQLMANQVAECSDPLEILLREEEEALG